MSSTIPCNHYSKPGSDKDGSIINASMDSTFENDPARRGSLTPPELDSIHQTNSFKQALKLQEEDNCDLAAKIKKIQHAKEPKNDNKNFKD
jgi:hypothetical protein